MTKKQKKQLIRIAIGAAALIAAWLMPFDGVIKVLCFIPAYLIVGWDVLFKAVRNIGHGNFMDENFLMAIASIGAFFVGESAEGVGVMLFYQVGEWFQNYAVDRSRKNIAQLMEIRPDYANIEENGELREVSPEEVEPGTIITVKVGERIPIDGIITEGSSMLDTAALTGESVPRRVAEGDEVISGCVNTKGLLKIKTTKKFEESTVSKVLDLVENATSKKAKSENFITSFARWYTPCVVIAALLLAVIGPLASGLAFSLWLRRALIFLVVSCPCALVISVPLSFFGGIGGASKKGVLIKGGSYMETLSRVKIAVFDKTGTITKGNFSTVDIIPASGVEKESLVKAAAYAEYYSDHPVSAAVKDEWKEAIDTSVFGETEEYAGMGVKTKVEGANIYAGNEKLMQKIGLQAPQINTVGTVVYVARENEYLGAMVIADAVKPDSAAAIKGLRKCGVKKCVMLTGDKEQTAKKIAEQVGMDEVHAQLMPGDKVDKVEQLLGECAKGESLMFVGDGINDAPVLSRADIGVAMGGLGSDAAIEAADIVLMNDKPSDLVTAISASRKTMRIVKQNIVFALAVKAAFLLLAAFGKANMWEAVFGDVGVSVIAILNAARALKVNAPKIEPEEK